jgi:hypothetical protein
VVVGDDKWNTRHARWVRNGGAVRQASPQNGSEVGGGKRVRNGSQVRRSVSGASRSGGVLVHTSSAVGKSGGAPRRCTQAALWARAASLHLQSISGNIASVDHQPVGTDGAITHASARVGQGAE